MTTQNRIKYIDFIKGICIFFVVWGHSIQKMGDGNDFWTNPVHEFICSFHMPIFMVVSGFFFTKMINKPLAVSINRHFKQFFWMGYFIHKHIEVIMKYRTKLLMFSFIAFTVLLFFYNKESYIYITGMSFYDYHEGKIIVHPLLDRVSIISYRYLIGFLGSLFIFLLLQRIYRPSFHVVEKVGTYTLGIYTTHLFIEGNILQLFNLTFMGFFTYNFIITPIVSIILISICIGIIKILEKNSFCNILFLGKTKVAIVLILMCLANTSCIKEKDYYNGEKIGVRQEIVDNPEFVYKFDQENTDNTVEITIKTHKPMDLSHISANIPPLKYNKSWSLLLTQDDCKQSAFSCTWAAINGKPLSNMYYYNLSHLQQGDLPPDAYYLGKTLGSKDGAGNETRFSFTTTISPEWGWMDDKSVVYKGYAKDFYRFSMKSGLVWGNVKEMLNYGVGISFNDMYIEDKDITIENLVGRFVISEYVTKQKLSGRGCKMLARPTGKEIYLEAAKEFSSLQTLASESGETIYPYQTQYNDLNKTIFNRGFYTVENLKSKITMEMERAPEDRALIYVGVHNTDATWAQFLLWLNNTYGKDGDDSVWMPSQEEFYEYNYYRVHGTTLCEQTDEQTLKLTVKLIANDKNVKEYFYYPSTTVNLSGLKMEDIVSIESNNDVSGLSYANYKDGIMLNIDCRKHLFSHALNFVKRYEADPTNASNKADALYFVNMLKESSLKTKYLERIK